MRGAWQLVFPEILFQNATRSNLFKALLGSKEQRLEKPRAKLKSLEEQKNSLLNNLKRIPPFSETRVERNSSVSKYEPGSLISQKFSQPTAWKISADSSSIPVLLSRSRSNTRVCSNSFSLSSLKVLLSRSVRRTMSFSLRSCLAWGTAEPPPKPAAPASSSSIRLEPRDGAGELPASSERRLSRVERQSAAMSFDMAPAKC